MSESVDKRRHSTTPASAAHDFKPLGPSARSEQVNMNTSCCNRTDLNRKVQQLVEEYDLTRWKPLAKRFNEDILEEIIFYCGICGPIDVKELYRISEERHLESFVIGLLKTGAYADLIQKGMCCDAVDIRYLSISQLFHI
jgi:hypothetical protein